MKIIYVELFFKNSVLNEIKLNSIRKYKNKYYFDCVFRVKYQNEYLQDILSHLIKKANLEKNPMLINYIFDNITILKVTLPKMNNIELIKNIDTEVNNLVSNYKENYQYQVNKVSNFKTNDFRVVLFPKTNSLVEINELGFKEIKVNKIKDVNNYQIIETIMKSYKYKLNVQYGVLCFNDYNIECYVLRNGYVIELFVFDIDYSLLEQYNLSFKYNDLLNVNNNYFKNICDLLNNFCKSRNIEGVISIFTNQYNEYLKKMIDQEIVINHVIKDYDDTYLKAIEDTFYEK